MARWAATVFVNSTVGQITTEVEAATAAGAKEQIYAKHGNVQSIRNLRKVNSNSSSDSGSSMSTSDGLGLLILVGAIWAFVSFAPWILMGVGGALGTWIGEVTTGQSVIEYTEREDDSGHGKAAIVFALALIMGGIGFVKGIEVKKYFDTPSSTSPAQVKTK